MVNYCRCASAKADCKATGLAVRRDAKAQGRKDTERAVEKASGSTWVHGGMGKSGENYSNGFYGEIGKLQKRWGKP